MQLHDEVNGSHPRKENTRPIARTYETSGHEKRRIPGEVVVIE